ncbi:MAG: hypothetical protein OEL53_18155 [Rhodospirillales bacterium]|nr:hypothetical protein [Rhodospirillales bacterium]
MRYTEILETNLPTITPRIIEPPERLELLSLMYDDREIERRDLELEQLQLEIARMKHEIKALDAEAASDYADARETLQSVRRG